MKSTTRSIIIPLTFIAALPAMACCDWSEMPYLEQDKTIARNRRSAHEEKVHDDNVELSKQRVLKSFITQNRELLPDLPSLHEGLSTEEAEEIDYLDALRKRFPKISGAEREKMLNTYLDIAKKNTQR